MSVLSWRARDYALAGLLALFILQLNLYFAWTSHLATARAFRHDPLVRLLVNFEVSGVTRLQLAIPGVFSYFSNLARTSGLHQPAYMLTMKLFIDCEVIVFTLAIFSLSIFLFRREGLWVSLLRGFEITSAAIAPLGFEIYLFDRGQFYIHASDIQVRLGLRWFTNADVLYTSIGILLVCVSVEVARRSRRLKMEEPVPYPSYPKVGTDSLSRL
jgi:hypothetical protein